MKKTPKLRFKEFSGDYRKIPFSDCVSIKNGQVDPIIEPYCHMPHIGPGNMEKFTGRLLEVRTAKEDGQISGKYLFDKDDVLYGKINPHFGKVVFPKYEGLCSADTYPLKSYNGMISDYLFYSLQTSRFLKYTTSVSMRTGMPKINREELNLYNFYLPSISEQEKLSYVFSLIDNKISLQSEKVEALKDYKKGIMKKIFSRELRFKDDEGRDYPEWEKKKVEECVDIFLGLTYTPTYVQKGIPFLSVKDISNSDEICFDNIKYISEDEYKNATSNAKPQKGDILFGRVGTLGNPIVINEEIDICIFVSLGFLRVKNDNISNIFISHWMKSESFLKQVEKKIAGSSQKNLNTGWLKSFDIEIPSIKEQNKICILLDSLDKKLKLEQEKLNSLNEYKKGLLQQMFI